MKKIYIILFTVLYLIVAFSSLYHAVELFSLANNNWMAIILAFAFEVGQAAVLFALLTSTKERSKVMPWVLMTMFTLVQVLGNVYSSYKHIILNATENLKYFKEPIFVWMDLPDNQATVIITYLVGGILPISALLLTSMVTSYIHGDDEKKVEKVEDKVAEEVEEKVVAAEPKKITHVLNDKVEDVPVKEDIEDNTVEDIPEEIVKDGLVIDRNPELKKTHRIE